ncbi:MAG: DNA polymerase III subunit delta' [Oligoflexia bacterium]|nr:DNA polymerase III subunit delta' [Oligoflexia bacterium]
MIFDKIVGHTSIVKALKEVLHSNRGRAPAFLFSGPSGVGKKLVALAWAQGLLCKQPNAPCGKCSTCDRISRSQHPDLLIVSPGESPTLKIEQIRDIQNFISLKSYEGAAKVVIIDEAQTMNAQSSNALLKTLEEPPAHCYFILVTSNKGALLSTIISRCQRVFFGSLSTQELKKIVPEAPDWALPLAQGRVDAVTKYSDDSFRKLKSSAFKVFKDIKHTRAFEGFTQMNELSDERESALFAIQCWGQIIKSAAALKLGAHPPLSSEEAVTAEELNTVYSPQTLLFLGQKILKLEQDIQANVNKNLAFEKFWIDAKQLAENEIKHG